MHQGTGPPGHTGPGQTLAPGKQGVEGQDRAVWPPELVSLSQDPETFLSGLRTTLGAPCQGPFPASGEAQSGSS